MTEEMKAQRRKPTIHELEAILSEEDSGKVTINADGSVTVKPAWTDTELTQLVKAARAMLANLAEGDFISVTRVGDLSEALVPFKEVE